VHPPFCVRFRQTFPVWRAYVFQLKRAAEGLGPDPEMPTPEVDPALSDPKTS